MGGSSILWSNQDVEKSDGSYAIRASQPGKFYLNDANTPTAFLRDGALVFQKDSTYPYGGAFTAFVGWDTEEYSSKHIAPWRIIDTSAITSVTINEDAIPQSTYGLFRGCSNLRYASLPEGLKDIGEYMFYNTALEGIRLPSTITEIGDDAFSSSSHKAVMRDPLVIPDSVIRIGDNAFKWWEMTGLTLGSGVVEIGECAFYDNWRVSNVTIGKNVKRIGPSAFRRVAKSSSGCHFTFEDPNGWWVSKDENATSGIAVDVANGGDGLIDGYFQGTEWIEGTYFNYYWNKD
jgi:hypothetical protein